jgi:hypothetical protein
MNDNQRDGDAEANQHSDPKELTQAEEAAIIARAKAEFDPLAAEAEFKELLVQYEQGLLISGDEVLARVDELIKKYEQEHEEGG